MSEEIDKTDARQAKTGTGLSRMLAISLGLAVAAMIVLWYVFFA
jgi:hypothetical protein